MKFKPNITKNDLVRDISVKTGVLLKESKASVEAVFDMISSYLLDNKSVELRGFGTFIPFTRASSVGRNPKTNEQVVVPAHRSVKWKHHIKGMLFV
jgi:nucleoid DNA-binding protein